MNLNSSADLSKLLQGVAEFNRQDFYTCHDTLEALWMEAVEPEKKFYQGILQIAVACYHLGNGNQRGAAILLGEGMNKLQRYQPDYFGIDVEQLIAESAELLQDLQTLAAREASTMSDRPTLNLPLIKAIA
jgi:uncharacterized protein